MNLPVKRIGRLPKAERDAIIDRVKTAMVEDGEFVFARLAEIGGISRRRISAIVAEARKRIEDETGESATGARAKLVGRLAKVYREAIAGHKAANERNDHKSASQYLTVATQAVAVEAKVRGIEHLPAQSGSTPTARIVFESFTEPSPALQAATARLLRAASGPGTVSLASGEAENTCVRRPMGKRPGSDHGIAANRDAVGDGESG